MATKYDLIMAVLGIIATLVSVLLPIAVSSLTGRKRSAVEFLGNLAFTAVQDAMREVANLKDPTKPGQWTDYEKLRVKDHVTRFIVKFGKKELGIVLGAQAGASDLGDFVSRLVEAQVAAANPPVNVVFEDKLDPDAEKKTSEKVLIGDA